MDNDANIPHNSNDKKYLDKRNHMEEASKIL